MDQGSRARGEVSIAAHSTDSTSQRPKEADSEASLRAELLGRLLAAQGALERVLEDLRRDATSSSDEIAQSCARQLADLRTLQDSVATAPLAALRAIRNEVAVSSSQASTTAQQARAIAAGSSDAGAALAASGEAVRREVTSLQADLFERRIFDPYLRFAGAAAQDAYREREAERRRYVEQQLATKTPEGELNAAGATMGQMLDAHSHGAGASPEFLPRWNRLVDLTRRHREALRAEGRSTEEFDRDLKDSVRRYLHDKGLSAAEIEAKLAISADPLEAVKLYLRSDRDAVQLTGSINDQALKHVSEARLPPRPTTSPTEVTLAERASVEASVEDVMAQFRAAGVGAPADAAQDRLPTHGIDQRHANQHSASTSPPKAGR